MKKLTLSADEKVIAQAKRLAVRQRTSVSAMFARFVTSTSRRENTPHDVPPDSIAARVTGSSGCPRARASATS